MQKVMRTGCGTGSSTIDPHPTLADGWVTRVVLQASGGYERLALTALHAAGLAVVLVEPARARHFARGLGKRAKTDAIDAAVLARMAEVPVVLSSGIRSAGRQRQSTTDAPMAQCDRPVPKRTCRPDRPDRS
jgi:transposase